MDIDHLKPPSSEDQMEMMMLMDKLPDFYSAYAAVSDLASHDQFPGTTNSPHDTSPNNVIPHFVENPQILTSSFTSYNTIPHIQEQDFAPNMIPTSSNSQGYGPLTEMVFRFAAMEPIHIDPGSVKAPPRRKNEKISKVHQTVVARLRRERIGEKIRILKRLVPGGTEMDTASMLDEAILYVKFLKTQVELLKRAEANMPAPGIFGFPVAMSSTGGYLPMGKPYQQSSQHVQRYGDTV